MSNAAKLKKKAAEFEQKKQFDKALQLYIQILDEGEDDDEEGDVALYNRVGDLLMRQGNVGDAMTYYEKAVDLYAESGFFNNAIALCNKILRQSPGRNSVYYKLGKISAKKGFISDAKQNFLEYASRMQSGGHLDEAFRALKEFADLCPDQDDIRLMLADQLSKKDRKGEALEQLQMLYQKFEVEGRGDEMRATIDRMRAIDPAAEPKTGGSTRSQKSSDLIFIDLGDGDTRKTAMPTGRPGAPKGRTSGPARRSGESRRTAPIRAEPQLPDAAADLVLPDQPRAEGEMLDAGESDLLPLPLNEESDAVVDGLESTSQFMIDGPTGLDHIRGFESSNLDDELSQALDAALPELEPPLNGEEFAALRLATPLSVPALMPPAHDLALPGELPPIGGQRPALSLTGEMELIIPDSDDSVTPPSGPGVSVRPTHQEPRRPAHHARSSQPPSPETLPLIEVDATIPVDDSGPGVAAAASDNALSLVGGAELLDVPEASSPSADAAGTDERVGPGPGPEMRESVDMSADDGLTDVPPWLAEPDAASPAAPNGMVQSGGPARDVLSTGTEKHRSVDVPQTRSPLARSVDTLRARVESEPTNWSLRRQLAEALLDAGDREGGLQVLEATMVGLERAQDLEAARSVADEIIRLIPNSVRHHQKRVEYAFRTSDRSRLPQAYLELADALFRSGQADKARAVYQRVLELSPDDARAQAALSTFGDDFIEPLDVPALPPLPSVPPPTVPLPSAPAPSVPPRPPGSRASASVQPAPAAPPRAVRAPGRAAPPQPLRPGARPDARPGARPDTRPIARPDARPDAHPGVRPDARPEARPEARPDAPPSARPGGRDVRPDVRPDIRPDVRPVQKPAGRPDARPGPRGLVRPGGRPEIKPAGRPEPRPNPATAPPTGSGGAPSSAPSRGRLAPPEDAVADGATAKQPDEQPALRTREQPPAGDDFINLGDWLRDAEAPRSTRLVIEDDKPTGDEAADFADMLRKFKQGIAENVSDEDHDSHYDLGVAYKEMGLVDEAVAEFQKALRAPEGRVRTYEALGQCFIEKQQFQVAATILSRALNEPAVTDDQLVGVLYLLGYASEALMRWEAAVGYYQRVFAVDIRFRDTAQRLTALERAPQ